MRILSIDYGKKRTGLAVTDPLQIIAGGLATVATSELFAFIEGYIQKNRWSVLSSASRCSPTDNPVKIWRVWRISSTDGERLTRRFPLSTMMKDSLLYSPIEQ